MSSIYRLLKTQILKRFNATILFSTGKHGEPFCRIYLWPGSLVTTGSWWTKPWLREGWRRLPHSTNFAHSPREFSTSVCAKAHEQTEKPESAWNLCKIHGKEQKIKGTCSYIYQHITEPQSRHVGISEIIISFHRNLILFPRKIFRLLEIRFRYLEIRSLKYYFVPRNLILFPRNLISLPRNRFRFLEIKFRWNEMFFEGTK